MGGCMEGVWGDRWVSVDVQTCVCGRDVCVREGCACVDVCVQAQLYAFFRRRICVVREAGGYKCVNAQAYCTLV